MMTLHEAISTILPGGTFAQSGSEDGVVEVRDWAGYMAPQNCEVLASGTFQYSVGERLRRTYLVRVDDRTLLVRVAPDANNHMCAQVSERVAPERTGSGRSKARLH